MAVVLGALASRVPWAPLVAFLVASPLTSPAEFAFSAGLFGMPFATTYFLATIVLGLLAGAVTMMVERAGWLAGQARQRTGTATAAACTASCADAPPTMAGATTATRVLPATSPVRVRWKADAFARELAVTARRLALYFLGFAAVGYLVIEAVPTAWLTDYLGAGSALAVPVAALLGIPVYLNTEASLPLVAALMQGGMGAGPALAFLVTGAGTSIGAITGMFLIARRRVVALVVGLLTTGAVLLGWLAPLWL
jgi:uncharacterized membrane protein YraQ (UPF0718 family)